MIVSKLSQKELSCSSGWKKAREKNNDPQTIFFLNGVCLWKSWLTKPSRNIFSFLTRTRKNSNSRKRLNSVEQYLIISAFVVLQSYSHRLVCHDLKGAWTLTNRRIAFGLLEAYTNAQVRRNLSWKLNKKPWILMFILTLKTMSKFWTLNGKIV